MSTSETSRKGRGAKTQDSSSNGGKPIRFEILGLAFITLGIILLLSYWWSEQPLTKVLHLATSWLFGVYGAWIIALALIAFGIFSLIHLKPMRLTRAGIGLCILFVSIISLLHPILDDSSNAHMQELAGGFLGYIIGKGLGALISPLEWIPLVALALGGVALLTEIPLWQIIAYPFKLIYQGILAIIAAFHREQTPEEIEKKKRVAALKEEERRNRNKPLPVTEPIADPFVPAVPIPVYPAVPVIPPALPDEDEEHEPAPRVTGVPSEKVDQLKFADDSVKHTAEQRPYQLPPLELLTQTPKKPNAPKENTEGRIKALEDTLASFGINAKVVAVEHGPRVTRFEVVPPMGIRINRITNLADNIALSLEALDVRIEAPVPGKGVVGIEVPNKELIMVDLREIVDSDSFQKNKSPLTFALGRDIAGHPRCADLTRMPHLLIAGATNSGKSVCINTLICSILMRATPKQVKFLLVDPKRVELSLFQSIPHLIAPVAYDAKHAAGLLRWAIREMEQRYELFAEKGVRNIVGFNDLAKMELMEELPYILIIIDELADLMMQAAAEFESSICRIAQLARATGIHLVVATQRPSVNVITGTIKANIPSRIAFSVASQVDSRTILDMNGAERLVGQGDMLYMPVDANKPTRIQGAYVSEAEINRIVAHVKEQGKPHFTDEIVAIEEDALRESGNGDDMGMNDEPEDVLAERALEFIRTTRYASTSMLQRKFRIGYTRAARLMEGFEEKGYIGPANGSKPREVIFAPASSVVGRPATAMTPLDDEDDLTDPFVEDEFNSAG